MKREWVWGKNDSQEYFETKEAGKPWACVFRNIPGNVWQVMVENAQGGYEMLWDKPFNDRQRRRQGLEKYCDRSLLRNIATLSIEQEEPGDASLLVRPLMLAAEDALETGNREYTLSKVMKNA